MKRMPIWRGPTLLLGASLALLSPCGEAAMDHASHTDMGAPPLGSVAAPAHADHPMPAAGQPDAHAGHHAPAEPGAPSPVPALTDADRAAVYQDPAGHRMHDDAWRHQLRMDRLEWQDARHGSALAWNLDGWVGGDIDRLWLRSEGERSQGRTEHAEAQALWGHAISPWWDLLGGLRQDFQPGSPQTWAALGIQGTPLYGLDTEATAYLGEGGQTALRLEAEYDLLLTQRLILQPMAELNLYGRNDAAREVGSGLADSELGLRLRYELHREFAPYVGVTWKRLYGQNAALADDPRSEARLVLGVRFWF